MRVGIFRYTGTGGSLVQAWHIAETEPFRGILAEKEVVGFGYSVFNPKIKTVKNYPKKKPIEITKLLVSGYMFVQFDNEVDGWQRINDARGIKSLMYSSPECPARIPDKQLMPLVALCVGGYLNELDIPKAEELLFEVGAWVKIVDGPFGGFQGTVQEVTREKVRVITSIFGRDTPVIGEPSMFKIQK